MRRVEHAENLIKSLLVKTFVIGSPVVAAPLLMNLGSGQEILDEPRLGIDHSGFLRSTNCLALLMSETASNVEGPARRLPSV